jgi:hypothetical protein
LNQAYFGTQGHPEFAGFTPVDLGKDGRGICGLGGEMNDSYVLFGDAHFLGKRIGHQDRDIVASQGSQKSNQIVDFVPRQG